MATENKDDLVLVEVPDEIESDQVQQQPNTDKDDQDDKDKGGGDDDQDEGEERRAGHDAEAGGETEEQKRERRRAEKKRRAAARRRYREQDQAELQRLRRENQEFATRLRAVEGRTVQQEAVLVTNRIAHIEAQLREADSIIIQARAAGNHADSLEAERIKQDLLVEMTNLNGVKQRLVNVARTPPADATQQRQAPALDPVVKVLAEDWLGDNPWLIDNPAAQAKVKEIDARLVAEGFNPKSVKFWNELSKRVNKALPASQRQADADLDDDDDDFEEHDTRDNSGSRSNGGGPVMTSGSGAGSSRRLKPNEVLITPERKKAMMDAGAWDDPERRKRMLKSFHDYDRANPPSRAAAR